MMQWIRLPTGQMVWYDDQELHNVRIEARGAAPGLRFQADEGSIDTYDFFMRMPHVKLWLSDAHPTFIVFGPCLPLESSAPAFVLDGVLMKIFEEEVQRIGAAG